MILTLHGLSTMHCNAKTEIGLARAEGFQGIEFEGDQLLRFVDSGHETWELKDLLDRHNITPVCINALKGVEVQPVLEREAMLDRCRKLCKIAFDIGCPVIQLVAFDSLDNRPMDEILQLTAMNIRVIADIGKEYGIKFQLEPLAFAPINSLKLSLKLIELCDRDNVGMVIDFWHLWAGDTTKPEEVALLNKDMIYGVHFCDGIKRKEGEPWNEAAQRAFLPGDGDIDIPAWVNAVRSTGYDGSWSCELCSPYNWEEDLFELVHETKVRMEKYLLA